ncbi:MAG: flagellar basal-body MS-ring/collar protein FliF [Thermodesulfovibrionales bacterium]|nr:flagellar basal-body MS-ring/collar protein FliF [Thermodesulfovibrionales bacterium]
MAVLDRITDWFKELSLLKKLLLLGGVTLSLATIILVFLLIQKPNYQVLYTNLSDEDAGAITQKLKDLKIPYKIEGKTIKVPDDKVHDLRIQLASQGLPQGGGVGFEVFDKTDISTTDFVQKLNYKRALQGELARTIKALPEIEQCRVHLAVPEKSVFVRTAEKPKASVFVKLKSNKRLSKGQVDGIVHLVASSVEGLDPKDVTVVDSKGELLTSVSDETIGLTHSQIEKQQLIEKDMEQRIISMLEPVIGKNKVRAKVAVTLNLAKVEKTEEKYDPEGQVIRSEQRNMEKSISGATGGAPGVTSNIPGKPQPQSTAIKGQTDKKNEVINYEITKTVSHQIVGPGEIKRLSAAVLVDGNYVTQQDTKEMKYVPRTEDEIKQYEEMAKRAIGFIPERGDDIKVVNMPFEPQPTEDVTQPEKKEILPIIFEFAKYLLPIVAIVLFFLFIVRPLIKVATAPKPEEKAALAELTRPELEAEKTKQLPSKSPKEIVVEWAKANPQEAANLIKGWISEKQ